MQAACPHLPNDSVCAFISNCLPPRPMARTTPSTLSSVLLLILKLPPRYFFEILPQIKGFL